MQFKDLKCPRSCLKLCNLSKHTTVINEKIKPVIIYIDLYLKLEKFEILEFHKKILNLRLNHNKLLLN
jgi:hypothetical protein